MKVKRTKGAAHLPAHISLSFLSRALFPFFLSSLSHPISLLLER